MDGGYGVVVEVQLGASALVERLHWLEAQVPSLRGQMSQLGEKEARVRASATKVT